MIIFLLKRTQQQDFPIGWLSAVVRAKDEECARELIAHSDNCDDWLDRKWASCTPIETDGSPEIIVAEIVA